jgi:cation transport regulator ChaB
MADFVKSAKTDTPVVNSKGAIEKMLRRYGATAFQVSEDYAGGRVVVSFAIPNSSEKGAEVVPIRIPVEIQRVYHALFGMPKKRYSNEYDPKGYDAKRMAQAERVAWRNLVLWLDAALSAATLGLQTITEAFFAHACLTGDGRRAIDVAASGEPIYRLLSGNTDA